MIILRENSMRKSNPMFAIILTVLILALTTQGKAEPVDVATKDAILAKQILQDKRLDKVEAMGLQLLKGFNAGTSYSEIWIRDFNTFIDGSLRVHEADPIL